jgi:hypothetical protein
MEIMSRTAELHEYLAELKKCRSAILGGAQSYSINGRQISRATLFRVIDEINDIESRLAVLRVGGMRSLRFKGGR